MNLEGWIVVMNGGQVLVGKRVPQPEPGAIIPHGDPPWWALSPVYDLVTSVQPGPGGVGVRRTLVPVMFADVPYLNLPASYAWCPVTALSASMQREIGRGVEQAEELRGKIRLGDLGLAAPGGAK